MAIFGGVLGLLISGIPFSVSAAIGFIALFGIAVMDGIIILSQYNQLIDEGLDRVRAVIRTGELQLRPVLMTCVVAGVGLLPAAMSAGIGSQVQKPLAVVVVTGMMLAPLVILVTLPVLISYFSRRARQGPKRKPGAAVPLQATARGSPASSIGPATGIAGAPDAIRSTCCAKARASAAGVGRAYT